MWDDGLGHSGRFENLMFWIYGLGLQGGVLKVNSSLVGIRGKGIYRRGFSFKVSGTKTRVSGKVALERI